MIDIHCHLLPGVDDGAANLEQASALLAQAAADGIEAMVVTPHYRHERWPNEDREHLASLFQELRSSSSQPALHLGAEIAVDSRLVDELDRVLPLAGSRFCLVEFPYVDVGLDVRGILHELRVAGWRPILAHPERIGWLMADRELLPSLVSRGVMVQITGMSVLGTLGRRAGQASADLLDRGLVHFLATDAHHPERRPALLRAARDRVAQQWGEDVAERITRLNPATVIAEAGDGNTHP